MHTSNTVITLASSLFVSLDTCISSELGDSRAIDVRSQNGKIINGIIVKRGGATPNVKVGKLPGLERSQRFLGANTLRNAFCEELDCLGQCQALFGHETAALFIWGIYQLCGKKGYF